MPLTAEVMSEMVYNISEELQNLSTNMVSNLKEIDIIASMTNLVEEKPEAIYECHSSSNEKISKLKA